MNDRLAPEHFPLNAIDVHVYGQMLSSPLFSAQTPRLAAEIAHWLNDYAAIKIKTERDGPTLVMLPGETRF